MESPDQSMQEIIHTQEFDGPIFQVKVDPFETFLAVEVRYSDSREVQYFLLDLQKEQPLLKSGRLDWWTGLQALKGDQFVLYHFEDPGLPVYNGIEIRKARDFELIFAHPKARLLAESTSGLLLKLENGNGLLIDHEGVEQVIDVSDLESLLENSAFSDFQNKLTSLLKAPEFSWPEQLATSSLIKANPPFESGASVAAWDDHLVAAWHTNVDPGFYALHLCYIYKGVAQWNRIIDSALGKLNPEPFFVFGQYVIWITERQQLCWCHL